MIDLHCHSYYSDGILSPEALIQKAVQNHVRCLSLTDHDTIEGYEELSKSALNTSIKLIMGIELSTRWKKHDIHILGYGIQPNPELEDIIQRQQQSRTDRAEQIGAALLVTGVVDAYHKASEIAGHKRVGRPHFAQVLINEGKSRDMQSAFKQYLGRG